MGLFNSRKGITPLVATILLVAFSVGIGALVMSWGEEYVRENAEFAQGTAEVRSGCDATEISIIKIGGRDQACIGPQGLSIWIDNGPFIDLYNIHARIAGENGIDVREEALDEPLMKSNAIKATIPVSPNLGKILQVKLTPTIWTGTEIATCSQNSIRLEMLPGC